MTLIGFTSKVAGPNTRKSLDLLREHGFTPIVITEQANKIRLRKHVGKAEFEDAIIVHAFRDIDRSVSELTTALNFKESVLSDWVNINDDTTAFFLEACRQLDLKFEFRTSYENCRIKPLARKILASSGSPNVSYRVHSLLDEKAPKEFLFPFVAKPMLGTGSQGVEIIRGASHWKKYLRNARKSASGDNIVVRGYQPNNEILVEELISGAECQIDGLVEEGVVEVCALGLKQVSYDRSGFREASGMLYRPHTLRNSHEHDARLIEWVKRTLNALEFRNGTFHIEVKVTGSEIRLLEINPRPGGGANVPAIKQLSGVDLNAECLRRWVGLPRGPIERPVHKSICFAVRYPSVQGVIKSIRKQSNPTELVSGKRAVLNWVPLASSGDALDPDHGEQYLGVLLAADVCKNLDGCFAVTDELQQLIKRGSFVTEVRHSKAKLSRR